jgi:Zn-dependent protease with chaperone function
MNNLSANPRHPDQFRRHTRGLRLRGTGLCFVVSVATLLCFWTQEGRPSRQLADEDQLQFTIYSLLDISTAVIVGSCTFTLLALQLPRLSAKYADLRGVLFPTLRLGQALLLLILILHAQLPIRRQLHLPLPVSSLIGAPKGQRLQQMALVGCQAFALKVCFCEINLREH